MSTTPGYAITKATKDSLLKRLSRTEGQIRGISRMVASDTYCIDVLTQISAAEAALDTIALELLRDHTKHCLVEGQNPDATTDELITAMRRLLGR